MGDMKLAEKMIVRAAESGADICKFQTWSERSLRPGPWDQDGRREIYRNAELSKEDHFFLKALCEKNSVNFLTSVFSVHDLEWLGELGISMIKIPSHEVHNVELIKAAASVFDTLMISTGAAIWTEVERIMGLLDIDRTILMHCVSAYPCPPGKVNLKRMEALRMLGGVVGYSGHYVGIEDAIAAICSGAMFVEKHFTIDQSLPGRDNRFAVLPDEIKRLALFRDVHLEMMEDHGLDLQDCEADIFNNYRGRWSGDA